MVITCICTTKIKVRVFLSPIFKIIIIKKFTAVPCGRQGAESIGAKQKLNTLR